MKVAQLVVLPQGRDLNGCGFHALFNASTVLARLAPSSEGLAGVATTTHWCHSNQPPSSSPCAHLLRVVVAAVVCTMNWPSRASALRGWPRSRRKPSRRATASTHGRSAAWTQVLHAHVHE
jgi:hypothetical protein